MFGFDLLRQIALLPLLLFDLLPLLEEDRLATRIPQLREEGNSDAWTLERFTPDAPR
jgi:hypothetical protein